MSRSSKFLANYFVKCLPFVLKCKLMPSGRYLGDISVGVYDEPRNRSLLKEQHESFVRE